MTTHEVLETAAPATSARRGRSGLILKKVFRISAKKVMPFERCGTDAPNWCDRAFDLWSVAASLTGDPHSFNAIFHTVTRFVTNPFLVTNQRMSVVGPGCVKTLASTTYWRDAG